MVRKRKEVKNTALYLFDSTDSEIGVEETTVLSDGLIVNTTLTSLNLNGEKKGKQEKGGWGNERMLI